MGVLLLTSEDELLLVDGEDALLLALDDESSQPGCVVLTLDAPSVSIGLTAPKVTITMETC